MTITIYRPRMRPRDRQFSVGDKSGTQQVVEYPAPTGGLDTAAIKAGRPGNTALVMDNLIPDSQGVRPRSGSRKVFSLGSAYSSTNKIERLISFTLTGETFAATPTSLYAFDENTTPLADTAAPTAAYSSQTSSDYGAVEMATAGGKFITLVNGVNDALIYNGTTFSPVGGGTYTITQAQSDGQGGTSQVAYDTSDWSYGWAHQGRQYFVEKGTMKAWYLGTNSIQGEAKFLTLAGVFSKSSELLFGTSFSTDSGAGIDDFNVFVSAEGEVAIYQGTDPSNINTWALKGLFEIGRPLGKNAHFSIAGDVIIATVDGLVPLSAVLTKDVSELRLFSLSAAIEPDIDLEIRLADPYASAKWKMVKSDHHGLGFLVLPRRNQPERHLYVVNLRNRAWCRFTGWRVEDMISLDTHVFFTDGQYVYEGLVTGRDDGEIIQHQLLTAHDNLGSEGRQKIIHKAKVNLVTSSHINVHLDIARNNEAPTPVYPEATDTLDYSDAIWGTAVWDTATWPDYTRPKSNQVVEMSDYDLVDSAAFQVTFATDSNDPLDCEITALSLAFTPGAIF